MDQNYQESKSCILTLLFRVYLYDVYNKWQTSDCLLLVHYLEIL